MPLGQLASSACETGGWLLDLDTLVPWRARPNFRNDFTAATLAGIYLGGILPFNAFIARDFLKASEFHVGLITAAPFFGNLISLPLNRYLSSKRPVFHVAMCGWIARTILLLTTFAHSGSFFAWVVFSFHVISAIPYPTYAQVIRLIYPEHSRGRLLGYTRVGLAAGMILSTLVVGILLQKFEVDWRWVYLSLAPVGFTGMYFYSRIRIPGDIPDSGEKNAFGYVLAALSILKTDAGFRTFSLATFVFGFGNLMCIPIYTIYQVDILNISSGWIAVLVNTVQVTWMFSYLFWGRIIDKTHPLKITNINTALVCLIPLNHIVAVNVPMLLPMAFIQGIVNAGIELAYFNSVIYFSSPEKGSQYQGVHALMVGIRGVIAPFIGAGFAGYLLKNGYDVRWAFVVAAMIMLVGSIMQWVGLKPFRDENKEAV